MNTGIYIVIPIIIVRGWSNFGNDLFYIIELGVFTKHFIEVGDVSEVGIDVFFVFVP